MTAAELKKTLAEAGVEVYRTRGAVVHVAERVRENLLLDSGVTVDSSGPRVSFSVRAQRNDFPGETDDGLFALARRAGEAAAARGYVESRVRTTPIPDPGDDSVTMDTWCEVVFEKDVDPAAVADEVRFVLSLAKAATRG